MALKLSGIRNQAIGLLLAAVVLIGSETLAVIHLIMAGDWTDFNTIWGILVGGGIDAMFAIILTVGIITRAATAFKSLRVLGRGADTRRLIEAPHQPDLALALYGGETLNIERHRVSNLAIVQSSLIAIIMLMLINLLGAYTVYTLLPGFRYPPFNLFFSPSVSSISAVSLSPNVLDWISLIVPLSMGLIFSVVTIIYEIRNRYERITADDLGITVHHAGHRPQFISWGDMHLVLRDTNFNEDVAGAYTLFGSEHVLTITILPRRLLDATGTQTQYVYTGGYDTYAQDARRLIATIVARSMTPLRIARFFPKTQQAMQQRFPVLTMTRAQALAAPLVTAPWQPLTSVPPAGTLVELTARPPFRATAARSIIWFIGLLVSVSACALISNATTPYADPSMSPIHEAFANPTTASIVIAILVVFLAPAAYFMAAAAYTQRYVPVKADDAGIMTGSGNKATVVAWEEVRAWGIIPPPPGTRRAAHYIIFTDSHLRLTWQEPHDAALWGRGVRGDRREAYRQRSDELHALIVAKTGQPLRDLGAPIVAHPLAM